MAEPTRRQLGSPAEVAAALDAGEPIQLVLIREGGLSAAARAVLERCRAAGIDYRKASPREVLRLAAEGPADTPPEIVALVGAPPDAALDDLLDANGAIWLLAGVAYPGNAGFAIRTAEVSGAAGIVVDANFDHAGRRQALRVSIRADRFFPVLFASAADVLAAAKRAGYRIVGIEDRGVKAPWDVDLTGPALFIVGGEGRGIPEPLLAECDAVLRIPMAGFIPSYNLQAAVAMIAGERLRQLATV
jgi:TrmH family RNA methyltransferase